MVVKGATAASAHFTKEETEAERAHGHLAETGETGEEGPMTRRCYSSARPCCDPLPGTHSAAGVARFFQ